MQQIQLGQTEDKFNWCRIVTTAKTAIEDDSYSTDEPSRKFLDILLRPGNFTFMVVL